MQHLKVRVTFTVDIDAEAWTANYGAEGAAAIREDVRVYVEQGTQMQLEAVGVLVDLDREARAEDIRASR